jgi:hypothetical protein
MKRRYAELPYKPMRVLLDYLRANGFKTWIVSGGGVEFLRTLSKDLHGVPPEQVVGSRIETKVEVRNGRPAIVPLPEIGFVDDKSGNLLGIHKGTTGLSKVGRRFSSQEGDTVGWGTLVLGLLAMSLAGPVMRAQTAAAETAAPPATAAAVTVTVTSAIVGSIVNAPPPGCVPVNYGGIIWAAETFAPGSAGFGGPWWRYVGRSISLVLALAWLWRLVLLTVLFRRTARLDLSLVPTHPVRAGGIGFLQWPAAAVERGAHQALWVRSAPITTLPCKPGRRLPVTKARPPRATEAGLGRALCEPAAQEMNDARLLSASFAWGAAARLRAAGLRTGGNVASPHGPASLAISHRAVRITGKRP